MHHRDFFSAAASTSAPSSGVAATASGTFVWLSGASVGFDGVKTPWPCAVSRVAGGGRENHPPGKNREEVVDSNRARDLESFGSTVSREVSDLKDGKQSAELWSKRHTLAIHCLEQLGMPVCFRRTRRRSWAQSGPQQGRSQERPGTFT